MKATVLSYKNNQLADCLSQNEYLLEFAYLCDNFVKLNKLSIITATMLRRLDLPKERVKPTILRVTAVIEFPHSTR